MDLPPPWVFAVVGSGLVILSAALSGFYTSYLERIEARRQSLIRDIDDKIAWSREYIASANEKFSSADLKLVILQSTKPPEEVISLHFKNAANDRNDTVVFSMVFSF